MKKLKRFLCLFLSFTMFFSMTGCSSSSKKTDPKQVIQNAQKKNSELTSTNLTMNLDMTITTSGESIDAGIDMDCKTLGSGEAMQLAVNSTIHALGLSIPMDIYYKDGCAYISAMNQKMKQEIPVENLQNQMIPSTQTFSLPDEAYKSIAMEEDGSSQIITFTADGSQITDLVNSIFSLLQLQSYLEDTASYTIGDINGTVSVNKDGYLSEETLHIPMTVALPNVEDTNIELTCTITNHNPGEEVTIDFPDFSEYAQTDLSEFV